jgi:hypothetical protein
MRKLLCMIMLISIMVIGTTAPGFSWEWDYKYYTPTQDFGVSYSGSFTSSYSGFGSSYSTAWGSNDSGVEVNTWADSGSNSTSSWASSSAISFSTACDDTDEDGVCDEDDSCPDTELDDIVDQYGCSLGQACICNDEWEPGGPGSYQTCIVDWAQSLVEDGIIDPGIGCFSSIAGQAKCGSPVGAFCEPGHPNYDQNNIGITCPDWAEPVYDVCFES